MTEVDAAGNVLIYVGILSNDRKIFKFKLYNASTAPPTLLGQRAMNFANPITNPTITPLNTSIWISANSNSISGFIYQLSKSNMYIENTAGTTGLERGVFIK